MSEPEIILKGGNTNTVVRKGDTVRRTMRSSSATVHRLLVHLKQHGYKESPAFLGVDDKNREILSYLQGQCSIAPEAWTNIELVKSTAVGLRQFHDITALYPQRADDNWAWSYPDKSRHEVICHNDFGLYNIVTIDNKFKGVIDFDLAGPGPRLRDIAYAVYWLTPLSQAASDMQAFAQADLDNNSYRLQLFCRCYGIEVSSDLLDMVSEVLSHMASRDTMISLFGETITEKLGDDGHLQHWQAEAIAFDRNRHDIAVSCSLTE